MGRQSTTKTEPKNGYGYFVCPNHGISRHFKATTAGGQSLDDAAVVWMCGLCGFRQPRPVGAQSSAIKATESKRNKKA